MVRPIRLWLLLLVVAAALVWVGIVTLRHTKTPVSTPITDLGATMPLNQPGGGVVSTEAYEVYSALYQSPMQEPLVFSEDSLTDIPQVNGSCLRTTTAQEREMNDAFVAANQQSHRWNRSSLSRRATGCCRTASLPRRKRAPQHMIESLHPARATSNSDMCDCWECRGLITDTHGHWCL